jgi:glucose 1-dehydrogenase
MLTLQDRRALVTGGGTGIGAATARAAAREGAAVALVGRRTEPLESVVAEIEAAGGRAVALGADLSRPESCDWVVQRAAAALGGLDLLFNNAALFRPGAVSEAEPGDWDEHFAVNLRAPALLCRAAYPHLKEAGGVVVNNLSTLAQRPVAGVAAYSATKAALLSLTGTLALEWAADGIRVVAVSPGVVDTPIHSPGNLERMAPAHPLGRVGRPEEIAEAVVFLAGPRSAWTTGSVLTVDGGILLA